ncbi:formylglycine-generating enzyme family protein [Nitrospina gracilis]|uniref:formylglycine-generating enzyme family protein n=1 Tax=Nitrospina gracilis TaxID=35801 RepID=UPI001F453123|nr:formylglycine-generating enzyme family protein [Nitrospina gracilis]MCF8721015.1 iron(II)-dependent oxidoreductase [Nitrospina gracilis Nb-211]
MKFIKTPVLKKCIPFLLGILALAAIPVYAETKAPSPPEGMVLIPEGEFVMGSMRSLRELDPTALFQSDRHMLGPEDPAHNVYLSTYFIDIHEVTNEQYYEFMKATEREKTPRFWNDHEFNQPQQPVVGVTWKEAQAYCHWRGKRLPTEAEWEKASKGTRTIKYPWGDSEPTPEKLNFDNHVGKTTPVGSYDAGKSVYGVHDLAGNVAEWVQDWHYAEYYLFSPKKDPQGPDRGMYKVIRGGHWHNNGEDVRLSYRNATVPTLRQDTVGFRCAKDVESNGASKTEEGTTDK